MRINRKLKKTFPGILLATLLSLFMIFAVACGSVIPIGDINPAADIQNTENRNQSEGGIAALPGFTGSEMLVNTSKDFTGYTEANGVFKPDYASFEDVQMAGKAASIQVAEEGMVLLKNEDNALPLKGYEKSITMFGSRSTQLRIGGGGAGSGTPSLYGIPMTSLRQSMEQVGYRINPTMYEMYLNNYPSSAAIEPSTSIFNPALETTYSTYGDAALVVFSRTGSEMADLATFNAAGHSNPDDHYLMLEDNEIDLIKYVKAKFPKVVVLLNSANAMEIPQLQEPKTDTNLGVDAVLFIGHVGNDGANAIGRILKGLVNPSGHTVNLWAKNFKTDPSFKNFAVNSHNFQLGESAREVENLVYDETGATVGTAVEYREDIYVGYRYYETVRDDLNKIESGAGDAWYAKHVLYPFGYGLSYTAFDWKLHEDTNKSAVIDVANRTVTMKVEVTNTGSVSGKDVVQVYYSAPYTKYGIEKASVNLAGFAKTKLLAPGETDVVTVRFTAQDMASFDWNDRNRNGFVGYELEPGTYTISARRNSNSEALTITRDINKPILCDTDSTTGNDITAVFSQKDGFWADYNSTNQSLTDNLMSRGGDMRILPAPASRADRTLSAAAYEAFRLVTARQQSQDDTPDKDWYVSQVPSEWDQNQGARVSSRTPIQLKDMMGVKYTMPTVDANGAVTAAKDADSQLWETFMNQLTWNELESLINSAGYGRPAMAAVGKLVEVDADSGAQIGWMVGTGYHSTHRGEYAGMGTAWVSNVTMASTWNTELNEKYGNIMGNEALFLNISGWYAPSTNMHRSPFGGRNFEYLSEDGVLAGKITAAQCLGATKKGLVAYVKHFAANDQETDRAGVCTWATEQALRELYFKPFELALKEGRAMGIMNAFNRIGYQYCATSRALNTQIPRTEWGFTGIIVTDSYMNEPMNNLNRGGTTIPLGSATNVARNFQMHYWNPATKMVYANPNETGSRPSSISDSSIYTLASPTQYYNVRMQAQRLLWTSVNSAGIDNGFVNMSIYMQFNNGSFVSQGKATRLNFYGYEIDNCTLTGTNPFPNELSVTPDGYIKLESGKWTTTPGTYTFTVSCVVDGYMGFQQTIAGSSQQVAGKLRTFTVNIRII